MTPQVEAMLSDYIDGTLENPIGNGRVLGWALVDLRPAGEHVWLKEIRALEFRQGHGTAALKSVCELADRHQVALELDAHRIVAIDKKVGMTTTQLRRWYQRFGFVRHGNNVHMRREPQPFNAAQPNGEK
jgi:GNAT superfamily N-acetyltransferase